MNLDLIQVQVILDGDRGGAEVLNNPVYVTVNVVNWTLCTMYGYCAQYTLVLVNVGKDEIVSIFKHIVRSMSSYIQRFHINHLVLDNVGNKNVLMGSDTHH